MFFFLEIEQLFTTPTLENTWKRKATCVVSSSGLILQPTQVRLEGRWPCLPPQTLRGFVSKHTMRTWTVAFVGRGPPETSRRVPYVCVAAVPDPRLLWLPLGALGRCLPHSCGGGGVKPHTDTRQATGRASTVTPGVGWGSHPHPRATTYSLQRLLGRVEVQIFNKQSTPREALFLLVFLLLLFHLC